MAKRNISIFDNFLSGGNVGSNFRNSAKATLKASTRILSRVACAVLYFWVALRLLRLSSLVRELISLLRSLKFIKNTFNILCYYSAFCCAYFVILLRNVALISLNIVPKLQKEDDQKRELPIDCWIDAIELKFRKVSSSELFRKLCLVER